MDPSRDRKTPYTEEELERFVDGFISSMDDDEAWNEMVQAVGLKEARETVKEGFRRRDPNAFPLMPSGVGGGEQGDF